MNVLKTAVDALRAVPLRLPSERLPEYGSRLRIWGLDKTPILKTAAAMVCAITDEADRLGVALLTETDKAAKARAVHPALVTTGPVIAQPGKPIMPADTQPNTRGRNRVIGGNKPTTRRELEGKK